MIQSSVNENYSNRKIPIISEKEDNKENANTFYYSEHILISAEPYCRSCIRETIYYAIGLFTGGILFLFNYWLQLRFFKWRKSRCSLLEAEELILTTLNGEQIICPLKRIRVKRSILELAACRPATCNSNKSDSCFGFEQNLNVEIFDFMCQKYVFHQNYFVKVELDTESQSFEYIKSNYNKGISQDDLNCLLELFGKCEIYVESKSPLMFAIKECLQPFYVFQICSIIIWILDEYYFYAATVVILSVGSLVLTIKDAMYHNNKLRELAHYHCSIFVKRRLTGVELVNLDSRDLVPGDLINLHRGLKLPCDALILQGTALVDESMMTGECKPVYKSSIEESSEKFKTAKHMKHILFGGSIIKDISTDFFALVIRTGFNTMQGSMLRVLIHNTSSTRLNFEHETWKFISFSAFISCLSFAWTITQGILNNVDKRTFVLRALDTVTIAIPPAFSIIVSVSTLYASEALHKNSRVRCLAPSRINVAGRASLMVFDKTGTLTEDDEDLLGILPTTLYVKYVNPKPDSEKLSIKDTVINVTNQSPSNCFVSTLEQNSFSDYKEDDLLLQRRDSNVSKIISEKEPFFADSANQELVLNSEMMAALATCHSLSIVNGELVGDSLEYQMLQFTNWQLIPPESNSENNSPQNLNPQNYLCVGCPVNNELDIDAIPTSVDHEHADFVKDNKNQHFIYQSSYNRRVCHQDSHSSNKPVLSKNCNTSLDNDRITSCNNTYFSSNRSNRVVQRSHAVLKVFEFDANLRRMSVLVMNIKTKEIKLYCKGAPESLIPFCNSKTCPENWAAVLQYHNSQGLRILAIAEKTITSFSPSDLSYMHRSDLEVDLNFQGYLLYTNMLREDTTSTIRLLNNAGLGLYIATGDSSMTAIAIALKAEIIPKNAKLLVSGEMVADNTLLWTLKNLHPGENTLSAESKKQSHSLLELLQGLCISQLSLAITGEALQYLVQAKNANLVIEEFCIKSIKAKKPKTNVFKNIFNYFKRSFKAIILRAKLSNDKKKTNQFFSSFSTNTTVCSKTMKAEYLENNPCIKYTYKSMNLFEFVIRYFHVFARMRPDDKALLIAELQKLPELPIVAMCGDGANDCSALRRADVGISLSTNEASVAAPFNSDLKSISIVADIFREGRGALANSIQNFQFVALYAAIQLCSVILLNLYQIYIGDTQFLYIDLITVLTLSYVMSWSKTSSKLHCRMPPETLLAWSIIVSVIGQILIQVSFQCITLFVLLKSEKNRFYTPYIPNKSEPYNVLSYENTVIFLLSNFQIVSTSFILLFGSRPWKRVSGSFRFLIVGSCLAILSLALILNESVFLSWLRRFLQLKNLPLEFRILIFVLAVVNFVVSLIFEEGIIRFIIRNNEHKKDHCKLIRGSQRSGEEQILYKEV